MNDKSQNAARGKPGSGSEDARRSAISSSFERFEKRQNELWRLTFLVLFLLVLAYAWTSWSSIRSLALRFEALPIGLVVLVVLFGAYLWKKTREISELRGLLRGMEERDAQPPSDRQIDQLFDIISRSQQGYRDLIDSFDDILMAVTMDGKIRACNRIFADLVQTPFQEIIGKPIIEFVQPGTQQDEDLLQRTMPRFLERRHWTGVVQIHLKNHKSPFYFDCVAHAMMRGEAANGITILARDVSALRRNETRFTELFETLQEGIYIATPDGRILDANPALVRMLGYDSQEDLLKRQVPEILIDPSERKALMQQAKTQPIVSGHEVTLLRKDGGSIVCLHTAAAVRDNAGKVVRYQGAVMDITERREIERRLRQQQEFARRLVDNFPDMILVLDTNSQYTFVSPRCREILGYEPAELAALGFAHCAHPEEMPAVRSLYDEIVSGKRTYETLEVRVRRKQGDWRRILFNFSPLSDEEGNIEGVVLSGRDVTDLKRLEEQLIQAEKLAAMGQMLAGVAHELNNPLTAVLGVTELLRERAGQDESFKRQLDLTHRQARRAARIVQNLLEFSRPASAQKKLLDVNNLIERTLQLHEHSLRRNNIEVDFGADTSLPGILGDANQLIQVFLNLVTNAEQAIREIRESGRLQIRQGRGGDRISITFQDDGVGIRPEALSRIFDPFYTTKRPGGGTGLGLSICMSIVREHGGLIEAEALPAGGSAFTVTLPVAPTEKSSAVKTPLEKLETPAPAESGVSFLSQATASAAAAESSFASVLASVSANAPASAKSAAPNAVPMAPSAEILKGRSVLVLDDEESLRLLLQEGLSAQGLRVDCAGTAEEALALIRRFWESGRDSLDNDNGANGLSSQASPVFLDARQRDNGGLSSDAAHPGIADRQISQGAVASSHENGERPGYDILLCDLHLSAGGYFVDGREATARLLEAVAATGLQKPAVVYMTGDLTDPGPETPARGEPSFLQKPFRISEVLALFREVLAPAEQPK